MSPVRQPEATRQRILESAFELFHACSFKSTSVNQIVEAAGITKGALFHHFKGKNELGYAVVDELLLREIEEVWEKPLRTSVDPVADILAIIDGLGERVKNDPNLLVCGCPVNNLAQEMSSIDEVFRLKLIAVYKVWQGAFEKALRAGIDAGNVRADIDPQSVATTLLALFEGSVGVIKTHRSLEYLERLSMGSRVLLDSLRP